MKNCVLIPALLFLSGPLPDAPIPLYPSCKSSCGTSSLSRAFVMPPGAPPCVPRHTHNLPDSPPPTTTSVAQPSTPTTVLLTPRAPKSFLLTSSRMDLKRVRLSGLMVSKGTNRVRVYLHASNVRADLYGLVNAYVTWDTSMA